MLRKHCLPQHERRRGFLADHGNPGTEGLSVQHRSRRAIRKAGAAREIDAYPVTFRLRSPFSK